MSSSDSDSDSDHDNNSDDDAVKKLLIQQFVKECVQLQSSLTKPLYRVDENDDIRKLVCTSDNNNMTLERFAGYIVTFKSFQQTMINRAKSEISNVIEVFKKFGGMYESLDMLYAKCHKYYIELELKERRKKLKHERKKSNKLQKEQDELDKLKEIEENNYRQEREARIKQFCIKHHDNHTIKF